MQLFAQSETFPYFLEYWKPLGVEITDAFPLPNEEYLLIARVQNYSPVIYPGLITDVDLQAQWLEQTGFISIRTNNDFSISEVHTIAKSSITEPAIPQFNFIKGSDNTIYFFNANRIGKINENGTLAYNSLVTDFEIDLLTYYNGKLYGVQHHFNNVITNTVTPGKLFIINADNGVPVNSINISDPTAFAVGYFGLAVDATGIYVMGGVAYSQLFTNYPINQTFYYTENAFQNFQQLNINSIGFAQIGFLTKYELSNPLNMVWSTYLYGQGILNQSTDKINKLKFINNDLYLVAEVLNATNVSTLGTYLHNQNNHTGVALMRFSSNGNRLMGTFLNERIAIGLSSNCRPKFTEGVSETGRILISMEEDPNGHPVILSTNAPYSNIDYEIVNAGTRNISIQEFSPSGERLFATLTSNDAEMSKSMSVIVGPKSITYFCWETEPGVSSNYLTTSNVNLNFRTTPISSVAHFSNNSLDAIDYKK